MRFLPAVLVLLFALLAPGRAAGASSEEQVPGEAIVHSLALKGVKAVQASRIENVLATRQSAKLPWGRKRYYDPRALQADLERIRAFYADRGYPDARVVSSDVVPNREQTAVDIVITIEEGEPVRVSAVRLDGFDDLPADHLQQLRDDLPVRVGRPRDRAVILTAHDLAVNELRDHGYPYAKVSTTEEPGADSTTIVVFTAEPGVLAHFGPVEISGQASVGENVIRRELDYAPGDLYRKSLMQNTQRRLYSLALFQFVNVTSANTDAQSASPEVPTKVTVGEGKHQRVNASVGYGSEEKGRVDAEYRHVNFFGGARSAGIHGRLSSLDRGVRVDFNQPYFFKPHLSLGVDGQQWLTITSAYQSTVTGARLAVTHRSGPRMSWAVSVASEYTSSTIADEFVDDPDLFDDLIAIGLDPTTGKQEGTLSAVGAEFQRSTADSLINPRRGYSLSLHAEEAGALLPGTFNYYALALDARHYQPIGDDVVVATRFQIGSIGPFGASVTNVPFSKKYFLGGATTLRGWGRYEVSPLSSDGIPIGGDSVLAINIEGRATIKRKLGGVLFLDAGNVWPGSAGFALNDLYYAIGPGIRYDTQVGPLRVDVGYQLNQVEGLLDSNGNPSTSRLRFHFSIGQAF